jgi:hypothetical protein
VIWRTREVLDYLRLMTHILEHSTAEYILIVEDDAYAGLAVSLGADDACVMLWQRRTLDRA